MFCEQYSTLATFHPTEIKQLSTRTTGYSITVYWENLFTTNVTFCVDTQSVGSPETLIASVCDISGTQYTFTFLESDVCEELSFTITPTDGVMNGTTSQPVTNTEYFLWRRGRHKIVLRNSELPVYCIYVACVFCRH